MRNISSTFYTTNSTRIGHITFAILTILAFVFFKERTIILDVSVQSFVLLLNNDFAIQVHRFGAAMTQIFPLLAYRLGGSLSTILIVYSLSFVLVHWFMFWLCDSILKQKEMAFAIVLFNVFMVNNTFFWVQNEVIQAISLNFVFWAMLLRRSSFEAFRWFDYPIFMFILITLVYFHPLVIFPFLFIGTYFLLDILEKKKELINTTPPLSISIILSAVIGFFIINFFNTKYTPNFYDPSAKGRINFDGTLSNFLLNIQNVAGFKDFRDNLWSDFALLPLSLMVLTVYFLVKKKILKLLYVWASVIAYVLMIVIAYLDGGSWFHVESQYLPMSIFVIMPLVWDVIPTISMANFKPKTSVLSKHYVVYLICIMIFYRLIDIYQTHNFYKKRVAYIGETLEKTKKLGGTKFQIESKNLDAKIIMQTWAFAIETLYYSALESPDSMRSIVVYANKGEIEAATKDPTIFQNRLKTATFQNLDARLFHQTDLVNPYILLEEKDLK
jgi:hypothetical protein